MLPGSGTEEPSPPGTASGQAAVAGSVAVRLLPGFFLLSPDF